jgi:hypothetical protein
MPETPADPKANNLAQNCCNDSGSDQRIDIDAVCSGSEKPAAIKAASAGNGMPILSSAMNAVTNQTP